jgi:hypothetical protein
MCFVNNALMVYASWSPALIYVTIQLDGVIPFFVCCQELTSDKIKNSKRP